MKLIYTQNSLIEVEKISSQINNQTFHHHYHILYDIANSYPNDYKLNYVEIGCYAGGSACLMLQRENTNVFSIDLGNPINPEIVKQNINKLNKHNNNYLYIKGSSHDLETLNTLIKYIDEIDVLFIDGDHTHEGVIMDFVIYSKLVKSGGYIIFDDYNDYQHSPEVKPAVDNIISNLKNSYNIIGTVKNTLGARPSELIDGNCFIIQKL
jgi:predicted O-methyltransferase YrrM